MAYCRHKFLLYKMIGWKNTKLGEAGFFVGEM